MVIKHLLQLLTMCFCKSIIGFVVSRGIIQAFFLLTALFLFVLFFNPHIRVFADTATQSSSLEKSTYELPYPGILPDNPLYFLKAFRDKLVSLLINDPLKKAEFDLLTSDKRLVAGRILIDKNKQELALSTLSKSNNYFYNAIGEFEKAKGMGKDTVWFYDRMRQSLQKHKEVLGDIAKHQAGNTRNRAIAEQGRLEGFEKLLVRSAQK